MTSGWFGGKKGKVDQRKYQSKHVELSGAVKVQPCLLEISCVASKKKKCRRLLLPPKLSCITESTFLVLFLIKWPFLHHRTRCVPSLIRCGVEQVFTLLQKKLKSPSLGAPEESPVGLGKLFPVCINLLTTQIFCMQQPSVRHSSQVQQVELSLCTKNLSWNEQSRECVKGQKWPKWTPLLLLRALQCSQINILYKFLRKYCKFLHQKPSANHLLRFLSALLGLMLFFRGSGSIQKYFTFFFPCLKWLNWYKEISSWFQMWQLQQEAHISPA